MDICFLTCICLWQISQIQTFLFRVVGPGLVSTSPAFVSNSASHPVGPHGRHAQKNGKSGPHCWGRGGSTQFAQQLESAVTAPPLVSCVVWSHLRPGHQCNQDDSLSMFHLKNRGPLATEHLTTLYNDSLNTCRLPSIWKTSLVIHIAKPGKDSSQRTSYRPI